MSKVFVDTNILVYALYSEDRKRKQSEIYFWDSLIVVAAQSAKCDLSWTEDLNSGQIIRNVRVVNPFLPD